MAQKVRDIDNQRMVMRIEHGKGGKERYVMLSEALLGILRSYWRLARPLLFLFPAAPPGAALRTITRSTSCSRSKRSGVRRGLCRYDREPHQACDLHPIRR